MFEYDINLYNNNENDGNETALSTLKSIFNDESIDYNITKKEILQKFKELVFEEHKDLPNRENIL